MENFDMISIKTPVGELTLFSQDDAIVALDWGQGADAPRKAKAPVLNLAATLISDYFKTGMLDASGLTLDPHGTPHQKRVWHEMQKIKPGKTKSYGQIAKTLKSGARAVGSACAANPIPILIPCHRVLKATGKVGQYSGGDGTQTKQYLLRLEGVDV